MALDLRADFILRGGLRNHLIQSCDFWSAGHCDSKTLNDLPKVIPEIIAQFKFKCRFLNHSQMLFTVR